MILSFFFSTFDSNTCTGSGCKSIELYSYRSITFEGNSVTNNVASSIAYFQAYRTNPTPSIGILGNVFRNNRAALSTSGDNAVLLLGSNGESNWEVQGNEFANPATSSFEVSTYSYSGNNPTDMVINGTNNLFGFAPDLTEELIDKKIWDDDESSSLPEFSFVPFLPSDYEAACASNCTGRGSCIFPGYCVCEPEWGGQICDTPTCQTLDFCNGRGSCVALDDCECDTGWLGESCSVADCSARKNCKGHGVCFVPNTCTCNTGYKGIECGECVDNYRQVGNMCVECPTCRNDGFCDPELPTCVCPFNFDGELCERCAEGYFGVACLPLPFIERVVPNDGFDLEGDIVRVEGINLGRANSTAEYACIFPSFATVPAVIVEDDVLECVTPAVTLAASTQTISMRVTVDGSSTYNSVPFTFYGLCPDGECVNGFCSFGRCQCYYGYSGETCEEVILAPVVTVPTDEFAVREGERFEYQLILVQGTAPVEYVFVGSSRPEGLTVDVETGLIVWPLPVASSNVYSLRIQAQNILDSQIIELQIRVSPMYTVRVSTTTTEEDRPSPRLPFFIETLDVITLSPVGGKEAVLWVKEENAAGRRTVSVTTDSVGRAFRDFQPYQSDDGAFVYGGEHPDYRDDTPQGIFKIRSMAVEPSNYYIQGVVGDGASLDDVFDFSFQGGSFSGLTIEIETTHSFEILPLLSATSVDENGSVSLSVEFSGVEEAVNEVVVFKLLTDQGLVARPYIFADFRERTPKLRLSVLNLDVDIARSGEPQSRDVVLQNIGSRASGPIQINLPNQPILRSPAGEEIPGLEVDEEATLTFIFVGSPEMDLGQFFFGTIGFVTEDSPSALLDYRATVVSTVMASLTVSK